MDYLCYIIFDMNEKLLILEIPEPEDDGPTQEPTKDIPNSKGVKLDGSIVTFSQTPEDIQKILEQLHKDNESPQTKTEP